MLACAIRVLYSCWSAVIGLLFTVLVFISSGFVVIRVTLVYPPVVSFTVFTSTFETRSLTPFKFDAL